MGELKIKIGADWVTIANADAVPKALFDAHTILTANSDNTPEALAIDTHSLVARQLTDIVDIVVGMNSLVGRVGLLSDIQSIDVANNTLVGRQGADLVAMPVAVNTIVGRGAGNLEAISMLTSAVVCNQGAGVTALVMDQASVLGKGVGGFLKALDAAEIANILAASLSPLFISSRWYNQSPRWEPDVIVIPLVLATNTIWFYLLRIDQTVSLDALGIHVLTAEAGKNARVAIYSSDGTPQPTTLIVESDPLSLVVGAGTDVTDPVTETELDPGLYWWAINADSTTAATARYNAIASRLNFLGSATPGAEAASIYTEAHAFGAFPATATPVGPTVVANVPLIKFQVV